MADLPISGLPPASVMAATDEYGIAPLNNPSLKVTRQQMIASPNIDVSMSSTPFSIGTIGSHINATAVVTRTIFDFDESNQLAIEDGTMWPIEAELGIVTLVEGAGVTLEWFDGAAVQTGTRTLAVGSGSVLRKVNDAVYRITGNGVS